MVVSERWFELPSGNALIPFRREFSVGRIVRAAAAPVQAGSWPNKKGSACQDEPAKTKQKGGRKFPRTQPTLSPVKNDSRANDAKSAKAGLPQGGGATLNRSISYYSIPLRRAMVDEIRR